MKTSTKRTAKVVVAIMAAIITILALMFLCMPAHTAGDSEVTATTIVSTSTVEEITFLEITEKTTKITTSTNESSTTNIKLVTKITTTKNTTMLPQEAAALTQKTTVSETTQITTTVPVATEIYVTYKPSTHYIHLNNCRWFNSECYRIENTEGIEARKCSECNPNIEIITEYAEPITTIPIESAEITNSDYILLCKIVASEYGGMKDVQERAKIVASVMNMVESDDPYYPDSVSGVLDKTCAPWGFKKYNEYFCGGSIHYSEMSDAVDYYFANKDTTFANWYCIGWWGDGYRNHFYYYQNGVRIYQ